MSDSESSKIGRLLNESLADQNLPKNGTERVDNPELGIAVGERLRAKGFTAPTSEDATPEQAEAERETGSLEADYTLLKKSIIKNPELAASLRAAFQEKLIVNALGADVTPKMAEQLRKQDNIWDFIDAFLKGEATSDVVITKMTQRLRDRAAGITAGEDEKKKGKY